MLSLRWTIESRAFREADELSKGQKAIGMRSIGDL